MFERLYKGGSNCDGGTLRNLINKRNVAKDVSGRFNECMDFFEMVVKSHIIAAGMHFFGLKELSSEPTANRVASDVSCKWKVLSHVIGRLVDRYVILCKHAEIQQNAPVHKPLTAESVQTNPHAVRIQNQGNGERIIRCWKFMLLYFRHFHHYKYALEAFHTLALVELVATPHVRQQIVWSRVVNNRGGAGNNIPVDLHMEHLNRLLKDMIVGIGANISESAIVQSSKSLDGIKTVCHNFDKSAGIHADSIHHTKKSSKKDQELVVKQLLESKVFSYIPGRKHAFD